MGLLRTTFIIHPAGYFYLLNMSSPVRDSSYMQLACHTRVASIDIHVHLPLTLKIKNHDYLRLVKTFTLISLTVSTSSTFEIALFHQL